MSSWLDKVKITPDRCVVKIRDNDENFIESVVIPTSMWDLPAPFRVFHQDNTKICEDTQILEVFDSVTYKVGHCYTNTENLIKAFKNKGINALAYAGWLFTTQDKDFPIWHSWVVIDNYVLDLSDNYNVLFNMNGDKFAGKSVEECRQLNADFLDFAIHNWKNSQRCLPVGQAYEDFLYVGFECEPNRARKIYNDLIKKYPNHKTQSETNANGFNKAQEEAKKRGLM